MKKIAAARHLDLDRVVAPVIRRAGNWYCGWRNSRSIELKRVIPLAPVADLRRAFELHLSDTVVADLLGGSPAKVPDRYRSASPIEMVPLGVEQRVIHGLNDNVVPISSAEITSPPPDRTEMTRRSPRSPAPVISN